MNELSCKIDNMNTVVASIDKSFPEMLWRKCLQDHSIPMEDEVM